MKLPFNTSHHLIILFTVILMLSCEKEELPVTGHSPGNAKTSQVALGQDYGSQIFYDLSDGEVVSKNPKTTWDLGFESATGGWHIKLNSSCFAAVARIANTPFSEINSTDSLQWNYDAPNGSLDSTAFGDYRNHNYVYVVDRGFDPGGNHTGFKKMVIDSVGKDSYTIHYSNLNNTSDTTKIISRNASTNFTAFSFSSNSTVDVEPQKADWDIVFTQYTHIFNEPATPYLVTGVLLNPNGVEVAIDSTRNFSSIGLATAENYAYRKAGDAIGYRWKYYNFDSGVYQVYPSINYVIKSVEGRYYKLHFTGFYGPTGEKGAPRFEWQAL